MGVTHRSNGDGTVTQIDSDTGEELVTFPDPDGSFTREHLEPVAASAAQAAPKGSNLVRLHQQARDLQPPATIRPEVSSVKPEPEESYFERSLKPPAQPSATAPEAPAAPSGIRPAGLPVAGEEVHGLTAEDRAARAAARQDVAAAQERSNVAQTQAEADQVAAREQRVQAESDRALGRYAGDLELHELAKQKTLDAERYVKEQRAQPIEPGQALGGNKFLFAIMAGVGASLSNFGAALLGQRGTADTNVVDDIIADSVKQQMADRQLKVEGGQDALEAARAEELRLSIRANASLEKWFEAKAAVEKNPEVRAAYASNAEQRREAIARDQFGLAEKEWNTAVQQRAVPKPVAGSGAAPLVNAETKEDQAVLAANGIDQKQLTNYGTERQKLGADPTLKHIADARQIIRDLTEKGSTDVPGVGPIDDRVQSLLRSNDASKVQQALGMVITTFVKNRSGAAVTDKEREYLTKIIQGSGSNQLQGLENGMRAVEAEVNQQLDVLNSSNPGAGRAYDQLLSNRRKRTKLSEADAGNLAEQRKGAAKPAPAQKRAAAPEPVAATPQNVSEFLALPENNPRGEVTSPRKRQRMSRDEELRQLLEE